MSREFPYLKLVSPLIDSGLWASMSSAARTLYPVLLRFSDGKFKPVYPGAHTLLKLTGFKQKSTLRKARRELVTIGLISVTEGSGRTNTVYHFRFDTLGVTEAPLSGASPTPAGGSQEPLRGSPRAIGAGQSETSPYNQIHISINNNVQDGDESGLKGLRKEFGERPVELALSECNLAGLSPTEENLRKILYRGGPGAEPSWPDLVRTLAERISPGSLSMIQENFREVRHGVFIFSDRLPDYLKTLLRQICPGVFFEPEPETVTSSGAFWRRTGESV